MAFNTYTEQIEEHIKFLRKQGIGVDVLEIDEDFVRCHALDDEVMEGRGGYSYKTTMSELNNGLLGIATWFRGFNGKTGSFQTYGQHPDGSESLTIPRESLPQRSKFVKEDPFSHKEVARRAYGFWINSNLQGDADYLKSKGVGAYGLRFRTSEQYGNVAIVPLRDEQGRLWSCQILNPDGSKRFTKEARTNGLFHTLGQPVDGKEIGISESYVTAATCMELTNIPIVCSFSCGNLKKVAESLRHLYPNSPLVIFADNDRHLVKNEGLLRAEEARGVIREKIKLVFPDFGDIPPSKDATDWNDLIRLRGCYVTKQQIIVAFG